MDQNSLTLLLLEDSEDDELLLLRHLKRSGFDVVWERVQTATELMTALPKRPWNLIISDYNLSGGFTASEALSLVQQSRLDVPFIVVSGTIGEAVAVALMKAGASDYLMKNNLTRLAESIRRELREADVRKQRRRAEAALFQSQTQTRAFLAGLPDIIFVIGADGIYQQVLSIPPDRDVCFGGIDPVGHSVFDFSLPELAHLKMQAVLQAISTGKLQVYEQAIELQGQQRYEEVRVAKIDTDEAMLIIRDITEQKQAEFKLGKRDRYMTALVEIQQLLLSTKVDQALYDFILPVLAEISGADRAYVFEQVQDDANDIWVSQTVEWCQPGVTPQHENPHLQNLHCQRDLPWLYEQFRTVGIVNCPVSQIPLPERQPLIEQGVCSILEVPLIANGEMFGFIGLDDCHVERTWDALEAEMLRSLATAIALAKEREQAADALAQLNQELESRVTQRTAALQKSEAQLQAFLNFAPSIIYAKDLQGRYSLVNHAFLELFACRFDDIIGKTDKAIFSPPDAAQIWQNDQSLLVDEEFRRFEEVLTIHGKQRTFLSNKFLLRDADGNLNNICGISIDITERQEAQQLLATSEEKFRNLVEHANDIIYILNSDGIFNYVSPNWTEILGHDIDEVLKQPFHPFVHPEDVSQCLAFLDSILDTGKKQQGVEYRVKHKDGSWRWHTSNASPHYDRDGNLVGCLGIAHDISDRKQAQARLQRTNAQLARATRLKDEFLANMSHELRTPLNAILGMTEGLQEQVFGSLNESQTKALNTIERSSNHLLTLINDILDLSKVEAGQMELHLAPTSISTLCQNSLSFVRQQAMKKKIQLQTEIPDTSLEIVVDERRINQVLINLLSNAVKFTPAAGTITLKIELLESDTQPPKSTPKTIRFAVIDTGIGIAPHDRHKLFRPFVQIDGALNRRQMGTGLGLALVKRIVQLHGGQIDMTSEVGVGSCFVVDLPAANCCEISPSAVVLPGESPKIDTPASAHQSLILLAEDNEANLSTLSSYLQAKGYELICARTGREALDQAITHTPNLILMDVQMPEIDGLEAIRQIRQMSNPALAQVPIIALTALAMKGDCDRCIAAGANHYMSKPVKLRELVAQIQILLSRP
ncbi:PAS domain S-box protein [Halomicronema sp. CCY15110]|uniref:PAS domain S-box protein n=1 Tax=Halomicronema sp. CCY15110 TaxID=2767773 RepID=UPI00194DCEF3|nr:PAS domain S-box protein [Halomicronema sp. CCY15110]